MSSAIRVSSVLVVMAVVATAAAMLVVPRGAEAGTAVATCTKAPDLRYDCTKLLAVSDHIQVNASGGSCHAIVTATGTISATLKSASISINHTVSNCSWQPGTNIAIGYRVMATPAPVGGIAGLLDGGTEAAAPASGGPGAGRPIALIVAAAAAALTGVGALLHLRPKPKP